MEGETESYEVDLLRNGGMVTNCFSSQLSHPEISCSSACSCTEYFTSARLTASCFWSRVVDGIRLANCPTFRHVAMDYLPLPARGLRARLGRRELLDFDFPISGLYMTEYGIATLLPPSRRENSLSSSCEAQQDKVQKGRNRLGGPTPG